MAFHALSIPLVFLSFVLVSRAKNPCILMAGQSNMIGRVPISRLNATMKILLAPGTDNQTKINLLQSLESADRSFTPKSVYEYEVNKLIQLRGNGYLNSAFYQPLSTVTCSFTQLFRVINYRTSIKNGTVRAWNAKLNPMANCGERMGLELMLGHIYRRRQMKSNQSTKKNELRLIKVASSGTSINAHWSMGNGTQWPRLLQAITGSIQPAREEWKGIIWFQGEEDSNGSKEQAQNYRQELGKLIANIRDQVHSVDRTVYTYSSDIPVIIVGLGCWVAKESTNGPIVMAAQRDFVAATRNTYLVPTDDLSCNPHYDDASMLIIGQRVGVKVMQVMMLL